MTKEEVEASILERLGRFGGNCALEDDAMRDELLCRPGDWTEANRQMVKDVLADLRKRGKVVHFEKLNWLARTTQ